MSLATAVGCLRAWVRQVNKGICHDFPLFSCFYHNLYSIFFTTPSVAHLLFTIGIGKAYNARNLKSISTYGQRRSTPI